MSDNSIAELKNTVTRANQIIVAATDMLEALMLAQSHIRSEKAHLEAPKNSPTGEAYRNRYARYDYVLSYVDAAIEKARGES